MVGVWVSASPTGSFFNASAAATVAACDGGRPDGGGPDSGVLPAGLNPTTAFVDTMSAQLARLPQATIETALVGGADGALHGWDGGRLLRDDWLGGATGSVYRHGYGCAHPPRRSHPAGCR